VANGIVPNQGLTRALYRILVNEDTLMTPWQMLLFVNDVTPDEDTVLADLVEPGWLGYSRRTLLAGGWTTPVVAGVYAKSTYGVDPIVFTNTTLPAVTNYGWAIYDPLLSELRLVQRFDPGDIREITVGGAVKVLPGFTHRSQSPSE